jgi:hypothetical protein
LDFFEFSFEHEEETKEEMLKVVPVWFQSLRFQKEFGSRMAPTFAAGGLALVFAWWSRDLLTDWLALLQVEGRLESAAMRLLAGETPYLDFYFTDTPGTIFLHALAHKLGVAGRYFHLLAASVSVALVFHWSAGWGRSARAIFLLLLLTWSFSLWNISHPVWVGLTIALFGIASLQARRWIAAGLLFGLVFWFQQQLGLAAVAGAGLYVLLRKEGRALILAAASCLLLPAAAAFLLQPDAVKSALPQIDWLPLLPLRNLTKQAIGAPLVVLGLWVLSLYFFRSTQKIRGLSILAVLAYSAVGWMREGRGFLLGCLFLFSALIWAAAPLLSLQEGKEKRDELLRVWLPSALFFFLFSGDFPAFLQLFPLAAFFLLWSLVNVSALYSWLPRWWFFAPALLLLAGGMVHQSRLLFLRAYASEDGIGRQSYGEVSQVTRELAAAKEYLLAQGPQKGILVLPAAPYFYSFSGLRNLTPFDVVTETSFAAGPGLLDFFRAGGKFLVIQGEPPAFLSAQIRENFSLAQSFGRFSVWRLNGNEN